jgi:hypothetical protein
MNVKSIFYALYRELRSKRYYFLTAAFSILLNWAGNSFLYENSYRFLYFDMLGTFVAAIVLGTTWSVIVALATAVLLSAVTSPHFIYLAIVNMSGAIFWGWLAESGNLTLFYNKKNANHVASSVQFIMFAGIAFGLISTGFSSVIRNFIASDFAAYQPYSLYFAGWFKQTFAALGAGFWAPLTNYVADSFIEIPDKILTTLFAVTICVTIFKFNITMLTKNYADSLAKSQKTWNKTFLNSLGLTEIVILIILTLLYLSKIKTISVTLFNFPLLGDKSIGLHNFIVLEMLLLPVIFVLMCVVIKLVTWNGKNVFSPNIFKYSKDVTRLQNVKYEIKPFLTLTFLFSFIIILFYMFILVRLTDLNPVAYYKSIAQTPAAPETFIWAALLFTIFILIDSRNNKLTETFTLNSEFIKKQTAQSIYNSYDTQRQKLQVLELTWSESTIELLRSARHDLINELEKSQTGLSELLTEVYDNVVKPYNALILENQLATRAYIEDITTGKLNRSGINALENEIEAQLAIIKPKIESYISLTFSRAQGALENCYIMINKLFLISFLNVLNNSVFALQKKVFDKNFVAVLNVTVQISNDKKYVIVQVTDNAGGLAKDKLSQIYKAPVESSKGQRLGEGAITAGNFIKLLDGFITARNAQIGADTGLETSIYIPLYFSEG